MEQKRSLIYAGTVALLFSLTSCASHSKHSNNNIFDPHVSSATVLAQTSQDEVAHPATNRQSNALFKTSSINHKNTIFKTAAVTQPKLDIAKKQNVTESQINKDLNIQPPRTTTALAVAPLATVPQQTKHKPITKTPKPAVKALVKNTTTQNAQKNILPKTMSAPKASASNTTVVAAAAIPAAIPQSQPSMSDHHHVIKHKLSLTKAKHASELNSQSNTSSSAPQQTEAPKTKPLLKFERPNTSNQNIVVAKATTQTTPNTQNKATPTTTPNHNVAMVKPTKLAVVPRPTFKAQTNTAVKKQVSNDGRPEWLASRLKPVTLPPVVTPCTQPIVM